jgi:hypothetical protein
MHAIPIPLRTAVTFGVMLAALLAMIALGDFRPEPAAFVALALASARFPR